jgi:hypothetical protein
MVWNFSGTEPASAHPSCTFASFSSKVRTSMDKYLRKRADNTRPIPIAAWSVTLVAFFLLITVPLLLRHRLSRAARNTWPPAPVWQGSGVLHAANGSAYPLYLKVRFERKHDGSGPADGKANLIGTASLCTAQKTPIDLDISGSLDGWWLENGKAVTLYFRTEQNSSPKLFFLLYGSWQGTELVLEDRGTLAYFFKTSTDKKSQRKPSTTHKNTQITLHYGEKNEFEPLCRSAT